MKSGAGASMTSCRGSQTLGNLSMREAAFKASHDLFAEIMDIPLKRSH